MADRDEENEDGARGSTTPNTKDAVKSLTAQVSIYLSIYLKIYPCALFTLFCCVCSNALSLFNCLTLEMTKGVKVYKCLLLKEFILGYKVQKYRVLSSQDS